MEEEVTPEEGSERSEEEGGEGGKEEEEEAPTKAVPPPSTKKFPKHHSEGKCCCLRLWCCRAIQAADLLVRRPICSVRRPSGGRFASFFGLFVLTGSDFMKTHSLTSPLARKLPEMTLEWLLEKLGNTGFVSLSDLNKNLGKRVRKKLSDVCEELHPQRHSNPEYLQVLLEWGYLK